MNLKKELLSISIAKLKKTNNKIWRYRKAENDSDYISEEQLIKLIKTGVLNAEIEITNNNLKKWYRIDDTIYAFYFNK